MVLAIIAQLVVFWNALPGEAPTNVAQNEWTPIILNQVVLCVSLVTACLPYWKPLMESLESGLLQVNIPGSEEQVGTGSYELSHSGGGGTSGGGSRSTGRRGTRGTESTSRPDSGARC